MKLEVAQALALVLENVTLRESYSGRGMYGNSTSGLVIEDLGSFMTGLINGAEDIARELDGAYVEKLRIDNMGHGYVVY